VGSHDRNVVRIHLDGVPADPTRRERHRVGLQNQSTSTDADYSRVEAAPGSDKHAAIWRSAPSKQSLEQMG
jgi:hypothetical protein